MVAHVAFKQDYEERNIYPLPPVASSSSIPIEKPVFCIFLHTILCISS